MSLKTLVKNIINFFIPKSLKTSLSFKYLLLKGRIWYKTQQKNINTHYKKIEERLKNRGNSPLRVGAYVVFDSTFGAYDLFDILFNDSEKYEAKIVVIPDVSRGVEHQTRQYESTKSFFINKYGSDKILDGYNIKTGEFYDFSNLFDIIYLANPYDTMVNKIHGIHYLSTRDCLPFYISYGCIPDKYGCKIIMPMQEISLFWKVFADNKMSFDDYKKYELAKGKNVVLTGYAKMDSLAKCIERPRTRKRIIIAPHHTINYTELPLSNFLQHWDFYLQLPKKFPDIDFVFRPHPLLFTNMVNEGYWTNNQVQEYIEKIKQNGMIYSVGGDYFDIFVNSDAMIHDCSSFVVEYLYTGKPCCFMAKKNYKKIFSVLGKSCLENYYLAFDKEQITDFIENVVINGNDKLKKKREIYAKENLALNYPNVSKKILSEISL